MYGSQRGCESLPSVSITSGDETKIRLGRESGSGETGEERRDERSGRRVDVIRKSTRNLLDPHECVRSLKRKRQGRRILREVVL